MRGRPAVYATFSSYDEVAHHSGLERADTLEALRKLDQQFGRIDRARRYAPRPYEIVVLSDHGQTQGATFKQRNGYGLDELVERSLERRQASRRSPAATSSTRWSGSRSARRPGSDREDGEAREERRLGPAGRRARLGQPRPHLADGGAAPADARGDRRAPPAADPGAARAPARRLAPRPLRRARPGRARRRAARTTSPRARVEGEDPLAPFSPNAPRHLLRTDGFAHVADIMVGSFYDPELEEGCAFEELISFHGGLGGPQTRPFILHPGPLPAPGRADRRRRAGARRAPGWRRALQGGERDRLTLARSMNLVWAALIIAATAALAVAAMLLVRRRAPEGSHFTDGDRASGVFGVLATGFSVLLGFIVFLAFESYDQSRSGAEEEALVLAQQVETAQFLAAPVAAELTGELVCYGTLGHPPRVAAGGGRHAGRRDQPLGRRAVPDHRAVRAGDSRARRPPTASGSTRPPTARPRGSTASTARSASSPARSGWCSSSSPS